MLTIFTDTDTDITPEIANEYGIKLISMPYISHDKLIYPYVDFKEYDYKKFYDMLRVDKSIPSTCALSPEEYKKYFEEEFKNGRDILYIHFSAAMTATFGFMNETLEELKVKYPDRKFYSIDTKAITIGSYIIVREIMDMIKAGKSIEEVIEWSKEGVDHFATYFYADDLKFFQKSGRVSGLAAAMGTLFGIKPIIHINDKGVMTNICKEKGRKSAMNKLVNSVLELGEDVKNHRIVIGHTDAIELAHNLEEMLKEKLGDNLNIEIVIVNPTCGSHCGPGAVGVSFYSKHR